jgi:hypothetical protein
MKKLVPAPASSLVVALVVMVALAVAVPAALGAHAATAVKTNAHARSSAVKVTVTVKTLTKTLLSKSVSGERGSVTKGGTPKGVCRGNSGAGALDVATHGRWTAKYYPSLKDVFIESILGVKPSGKDYWGIYVNGKVAQTGACGIKLTAGEKLLFKIVK